MTRIKLLATICFLAVPALALAELPNQLLQDYAPLEGYVVMQVEDEYLIDLDAEDGLREGDILSLVVPGEKIVHPVTKEVIGRLDSSEGFLRVTRLKSGYSYAHLMPSSATPEKSDPVRRFDQVPARVQGSRENARGLEQELKAALDHFVWVSGTDGKTDPLLTFEIGSESLTVKTAGGMVRDRYSLPESSRAADDSQQTSRSAVTPEAKPESPRPVPAATTKPDEAGKAAAASAQGGIIRREESAQEGIWFGPNLKGAAIGVAVDDFDGDGQNETALLLDRTLTVGRKSADGFQKLAETEISVALTPLGLSAADLDENGRAELYVSAMRENKVASVALDYTGKGLVESIDNIDWHLNAVDLPGEGEVLLGQPMDKDGEFYGQPFRVVERSGGSLSQGQILNVPEHVDLYGFGVFDDENGQRLFAYLSATDYLKVATAAGEILWESDDYFGGSEIRYEIDKKLRDETTIKFIRPRVLVNDSGQVIVGRNDGMRLLSRYRKFDESEIVALQWNGLNLSENWRTQKQDGYLADFALADYDNDGRKELVTLVKFKHSGLFGSARSAIVVYELED